MKKYCNMDDKFNSINMYPGHYQMGHYYCPMMQQHMYQMMCNPIMNYGMMNPNMNPNMNPYLNPMMGNMCPLKNNMYEHQEMSYVKMKSVDVREIQD